jgi:hypothetical protein
MHRPAIRCAWEYMGADPLRFGTDYPKRASGTAQGNLEPLGRIRLSAEDKKRPSQGMPRGSSNDMGHERPDAFNPGLDRVAGFQKLTLLSACTSWSSG